MMSIAARVIMLFDGGKMSRTLFAPLEALGAVVTDAIGEADRAP